MCSALSLKSFAAQKKWIHLKRCIRVRPLLDRAEITFTTTILSHSTNTCCWCHAGPQMTYTTAMGTNSLAAIFSPAHSLSHCCWSHACCHTAPHPHEPDASEANVTVGVHRGRWTSIILLAFQEGRKASHQARSAWNSALSLIQWSRFLALVDRSIILLRKIHPTCTTLQA